jgi:glycosyltransferase involved in cell wall biosynthesis
MTSQLTQPLLSVCIPTYNRSGLLRVSLDSIFSQLENENLTKDVEVVVSDNASIDNTEELVKEYQQKFTQLKYFRNQKNLGCDLNTENAVLHASGKYCWYLGDDDVLVPGSLSFISELLIKYQPAVLTVDCSPLSGTAKVPGAEFSVKGKTVEVLQSFQQFMEKGYCLGILSTIMFDRELWLNVERKNFAILWLYYETVLKLMSRAKSRNFVHIGEPCVLTGQSCDWSKNGQELYSFLEWKELLTTLGQYGYDEGWIQRELKHFPMWLIMILLRSKGHDLPMNFKYLKRIYKSFPGQVLYLALATLIFFVPNIFIKTIRNGKSFFARRVSKI